jgi:hypothetical protein
LQQPVTEDEERKERKNAKTGTSLSRPNGGPGRPQNVASCVLVGRAFLPDFGAHELKGRGRKAELRRQRLDVGGSSGFTWPFNYDNLVLFHRYVTTGI